MVGITLGDSVLVTDTVTESDSDSGSGSSTGILGSSAIKFTALLRSKFFDCSSIDFFLDLFSEWESRSSLKSNQI